MREIELNQQYNNKIKEHLLKHYIFKQIGFNKISIDELEYIYNQTKDENVKYNIAMIYSKNGEYNKSINLIEKIILSNNNYEFNYCNFPAEIKDILYPRYWYNDLIEKNAVYYNINSYLIRALIREESRYNFKAVSNANAYGLMQIIPATGKWIARKLGFNYFKNYQLYQPSINISFGTYYLSVLLEKYNKDVIKALAAYNGGGGNVDNWLKRLKINDVDYFVEKIPFSETKNYVKNVLKSFYIYSLMYAGNYRIEYSYNKTNYEVNKYD
ncbi:MAG TPA: lytic transglycosylase domain-containing protein [bacterium]|nr:lytic transglycosylase domain-containing protein [bacterium]